MKIETQVIPKGNFFLLPTIIIYTYEDEKAVIFTFLNFAIAIHIYED